ncbi:MAG: tRNA dihydrouridine synthase DusB [Sorangium cellulosum]|nr:MAG: tRNA dihydrouridine synthase DusB [Sorangium cellulosum]
MTPAPLLLGDHQLDPPLLLAPMAAITTVPMRCVAEAFGAALTYTEMVSTAALFRGVKAARALLKPSSKGYPFAVQLFGSDPYEMEYAAHYALNAGVHVLDINMGCPMKDIVRHGAGSALMKTPELAAQLVRAARRGVEESIPVTVKIRAGWDANAITATEFAKTMEQAGAQWITVHGRTRAQLYKGTSDPQVIAGVVQAVHVPVIANGDIRTAQDAKQILEITGAQGVMVARGSFGNPWLFRDIKRLFRGESPLPPPTPKERLEVLWHHLELVKIHGENPAQKLMEIKKQISWYSKSLKDSSVFRNHLFRLNSLEEIETLIHNQFGKQLT